MSLSLSLTCLSREGINRIIAEVLLRVREEGVSWYSNYRNLMVGPYFELEHSLLSWSPCEEGIK